MSIKSFLLLLVPILLLGACGSAVKTEAKYPTGADRSSTGNDIYAEPETIWGKDDGFGLFGNKKEGGDESGVSVNAFLWRAALDTVSFMPLVSADPFGGVILTDWYTDPSVKNERTKLNVFVMGRQLKADGIKVKAFRQVLKGGAWKDAPIATGTERKLEDAILTRAREIRVAKEE